MADVKIQYNAPRDVERAHSDERFDRVLHVFSSDWHGIRSATSCVPGLKLGIPHDRPLSGLELHSIISIIVSNRVQNIIYQGYSSSAHKLAEILAGDFGATLNQYVITHVSPSQFEHLFELEMLGLIQSHVRSRVFRRAASVKPKFHETVGFFDRGTIYNCGPRAKLPVSKLGCYCNYAFVPVENTWRKNLYVNLVGAIASEVDEVLCVNAPSFLEHVVKLDKVRVVGWQTPATLLGYMRSALCVLNVTLIECQPMTQLEAAAVGTPCITGPLRIEELKDHELTRLTEIDILDEPRVVAKAINNIKAYRDRDEAGFQALLADFLEQRLRLCLDSYSNLLS